MKKRNGFSLIEMLVTLVAGTVVIVTTASLYGFIALRASDSVSQYNAINDLQVLYGELGDHVSHAVSAEIVTFGERDALKLTMPVNGVDKDDDGIFDTWNIIDVNSMNREVWGVGIRLWYYTADITGNPNSEGRYVFRAIRNDDLTITTSDIDRQWSFVEAGHPRVYVPGDIIFSNNVNDRITIVSTMLNQEEEGRPDDGPLTGIKASTNTNMLMDRRFYWRGARL
jgi:prepilin-type N-terminal cleavage/methylation domain-containing protein